MTEKPLHKDDKLRISGKISVLILFNDEINTFDHVISSLVEICGHDVEQAEQCALIVHNRGFYEVKTGSWKVLEKMNRSLNEKGLKSEVRSL